MFLFYKHLVATVDDSDVNQMNSLDAVTVTPRPTDEGKLFPAHFSLSSGNF